MCHISGVQWLHAAGDYHVKHLHHHRRVYWTALLFILPGEEQRGSHLKLLPKFSTLEKIQVVPWKQ